MASHDSAHHRVQALSLKKEGLWVWVRGLSGSLYCSHIDPDVSKCTISVSAKSLEQWLQHQTALGVPSSSCLSRVNLDKSTHFLEPRFPHLCHGDDNVKIRQNSASKMVSALHTLVQIATFFTLVIQDDLSVPCPRLRSGFLVRQP